MAIRVTGHVPPAIPDSYLTVPPLIRAVLTAMEVRTRLNDIRRLYPRINITCCIQSCRKPLVTVGKDVRTEEWLVDPKECSPCRIFGIDEEGDMQTMFTLACPEHRKATEQAARDNSATPEANLWQHFPPILNVPEGLLGKRTAGTRTKEQKTKKKGKKG